MLIGQTSRSMTNRRADNAKFILKCQQSFVSVTKQSQGKIQTAKKRILEQTEGLKAIFRNREHSQEGYLLILGDGILIVTLEIGAYALKKFNSGLDYGHLTMHVVTMSKLKEVGKRP